MWDLDKLIFCAYFHEHGHIPTIRCRQIEDMTNDDKDNIQHKGQHIMADTEQVNCSVADTSYCIGSNR